MTGRADSDMSPGPGPASDSVTVASDSNRSRRREKRTDAAVDDQREVEAPAVHETGTRPGGGRRAGTKD